MNIAKMILLACPVFLASILIANSAQASSLKPASDTQIIAVASTQSMEQLVTLDSSKLSHPIMDQLGCNCAVCFQSKFQSLQGKLPSLDF
ncbi:hypothetical protein [Umezakia ovalisporum]|jgi:hypothetical protein|uniref:Uncharacterized protein n=2 Tax=Umezakia ovalisporum TaxID=75695 RepID=A0AA43KG97_9CYAN|nr:hypothetical protein [Nostoc sp. RI_552]MDH6058476.1 hypothetical protein [Umezakia ovalisporum FSS-43]MDH6065426.1 hypothetical protein [Umezakia ovalisporum FSS-62]MDH6067029.1 hypothetical protein [Umezakia ovalisporum APH033B]MDH6071640.1 hypothetical protein [Umezakia ovalisporum CobakiLakeA]MDH6073202.1 hypothetical protein [Umezakia ovalisporum CS-1034]MDH6076489.1 hypothetical protein [Umezakia ovalisporum FSS-45]MDH6080387.1 hypothetical protein [Umezakia ovalisporum FSS-44]MDH6